jgi:hypothetical protein
MRLCRGSVSWLLIAALSVLGIFLITTRPAVAACDKDCGFCVHQCTTRIDSVCGGDACVVFDCRETDMCSNLLICGNTCSGNLMCCSGAYADMCGVASDCQLRGCPCW